MDGHKPVVVWFNDRMPYPPKRVQITLVKGSNPIRLDLTSGTKALIVSPGDGVYVCDKDPDGRLFMKHAYPWSSVLELQLDDYILPTEEDTEREKAMISAALQVQGKEVVEDEAPMEVEPDREATDEEFETALAEATEKHRETLKELAKH